MDTFVESHPKKQKEKKKKSIKPTDINFSVKRKNTAISDCIYPQLGFNLV